MEITTILLDTSAYAAFKRGHEEVINLVRSAGRIVLPAVVIGELLAGFEAGSRRERNRAELELFCESVRVEVVPISWATAERYAAIYKYLRAEGSPIPTNDLWIAAAAMERGAVVITLDKHFRLMPQIIAVILSADM
jgi:tRNA(fMet)-specific endonuclease VapC